MKQIILFTLLLFSLVILSANVFAMTASEAKQEWYNAKAASIAAQSLHNDAKLAYAADRNAENDKKVVNTGKDLLNAALNEAEAWIVWVDLEVKENPEISAGMKEQIASDVQTNLAKIPALRTEVNDANSQLDLGIVFLKMVGKYLELVSDVARDTGKVWVELGNKYIDRAEEYESKLRTQAANLPNSSSIISKLDSAKSELAKAQQNVDNAETAYNLVVLPGMPVLKFAEGNSYLRAGQANLLAAIGYMNQAYAEILSGGA